MGEEGVAVALERLLGTSQFAEPLDAAKRIDPLAARGISRRLWRIYVHVWLVCVLFPFAALVQAGPGPAHWLIATAGLAIFIVCYIWLMRPYPLSSAVEASAYRPLHLVAIPCVIVLILSLSVAYGSAFLWLLVGASAMAGKTLPAKSAHLVITVLPLVALGAGAALNGSVAGADWLHLIPLALLVRVIGLDMVGLSLLSGTIRELDTARAELARQAVLDERLRLARDLHDLLGHTLSLITLKSELAGRLIEHDPSRAAQEIHEVERTARQTLNEVREAVAGYRQPTLDSALDGARQLLAAAGITCRIEHTAGALPPAIDAVLAWTVREGVTNVIRHSHAQQCVIHVACRQGAVYAEISNDGFPVQDTSDMKVGNGLPGLAERVAAQGGQMQAVPLAAKGFCLRVELPLPGGKGTA